MARRRQRGPPPRGRAPSVRLEPRRRRVRDRAPAPGPRPHSDAGAGAPGPHRQRGASHQHAPRRGRRQHRHGGPARSPVRRSGSRRPGHVARSTMARDAFARGVHLPRRGHRVSHARGPVSGAPREARTALARAGIVCRSAGPLGSRRGEPARPVDLRDAPLGSRPAPVETPRAMAPDTAPRGRRHRHASDAAARRGVRDDTGDPGVPRLLVPGCARARRHSTHSAPR